MTAVTASAPRAPTREDVDQTCDDPGLPAWWPGPGGGDVQAWDALVERYAPLIWSICRKYRLGVTDGKISEEWAADDIATIMAQLSVFSPPWAA